MAIGQLPNVCFDSCSQGAIFNNLKESLLSEILASVQQEV